MKTIGMIGGMSWESSEEYYRYINEGIKEKLGGFHSAKCVMVSIDFSPMEAAMRSGDWDSITAILVDAAKRLERSGADFILICTNTMHKMAPQVQQAVSIPILHIIDATVTAVKAAGMDTIGLLGTRFTMEEQFYAARLAEVHGLKVLIPEAEERVEVHRIIFDELCLGSILSQSRAAYQQIIRSLQAKGAQGIILGCTEIGLLLRPEDSELPLFDTTRLHAEAAVDYALDLLGDQVMKSVG
jgi:aspartate racemase